MCVYVCVECKQGKIVVIISQIVRMREIQHTHTHTHTHTHSNKQTDQQCYRERDVYIMTHQMLVDVIILTCCYNVYTWIHTTLFQRQ